MTTKERIKAEIEQVDDEQLDELYQVIQQFLAERRTRKLTLTEKLKRIQTDGSVDFRKRLMTEEAVEQEDVLPAQQMFLRLPIRERKRLLKQQAAIMVDYYQQTASEREEWQAGDFVDY